jgi:hypothetical protein
MLFLLSTAAFSFFLSFNAIFFPVLCCEWKTKVFVRLAFYAACVCDHHLAFSLRATGRNYYFSFNSIYDEQKNKLFLSIVEITNKIHIEEARCGDG